MIDFDLDHGIILMNLNLLTIDIKYILNTKYNGFTIIPIINLDKVTVDKNVFLSPKSWGTIHVSKHLIYLVYSYYG